jgi:hypothetical protein
MKKIRVALVAAAILVGAGAAFASAATRTADNTYFVTGQDGNNWKVTTTPITCNGSVQPCQVTANQTPVNGEIPKSSVTQILTRQPNF